ncbi:MAG: NADP-dependent oxidoreductase [Rhodospirillaceae bacterium]|nr:NADP-dependent oxidoreductase [Rhodospirillaceae bacterium]
MDYRYLGRSGLKVSPLCLGTMLFGRETSSQESQLIIESAREIGVNFIDTADTYVSGDSERLVGRCIKTSRNSWVLATKLANKMSDNPNSGGLSRKWVLQACEDSLKRLKSEYIDIYYLHKEDHNTPLEETIKAMGDLIREGKIRYFGLSNYRSWRVAEICNICDNYGIDRPIVSQPYYNAMNRMPEIEHIPACVNYGLGVVPYSPLARGVLTGKYSEKGKPEKGSRVDRKDRRIMQTEWRLESIEIVKKIKSYARKRGATTIDIAIGWLLNNSAVDSIVAGPRTLDQWNAYAAALNYNFNAEDEALIDRYVTTGHPSTPGYNDPSYPIEGRYSKS